MKAVRRHSSGSDSEALRHTYSDVVVSQSPSSSLHDMVGNNKAGDAITSNIVEVNTHIEGTTDQFGSEIENDEGHWTTVQRRRAASPEMSTKLARKKSSSGKTTQTLDKKLTSIVNEAEELMTPAERDKVSRRSKKLNESQNEGSPSRGERISKAKGKGVDPRIRSTNYPR